MDAGNQKEAIEPMVENIYQQGFIVSGIEDHPEYPFHNSRKSPDHDMACCLLKAAEKKAFQFLDTKRESGSKILLTMQFIPKPEA